MKSSTKFIFDQFVIFFSLKKLVVLNVLVYIIINECLLVRVYVCIHWGEHMMCVRACFKFDFSLLSEYPASLSLCILCLWMLI